MEEPTALLLGCSVRVIGLDVGPGQNSTAVCQNETAAAEFSCVVDVRTDPSQQKNKTKQTTKKNGTILRQRPYCVPSPLPSFT